MVKFKHETAHRKDQVFQLILATGEFCRDCFASFRLFSVSEHDEGNQIELIYCLSYSMPSSGVRDRLDQLFTDIIL